MKTHQKNQPEQEQQDNESQSPEPVKDLAQFIDINVSDDCMKVLFSFKPPKDLVGNLNTQVIYTILDKKSVTTGIKSDEIKNAVADFNKNRILFKPARI